MTLSRRAALFAAPFLRAKRRSLATAPTVQNYVIFTPDYEVRLRIEFFDRFSSNGFQFKDLISSTSFCLGSNGERDQNCLRGFTGSLALARFEVKQRSREVNRIIQLREHVRMIDRHELLSERPAYDRTIEVPRGVGTDLQAFGYQPDPQVAAVSNEDAVWCLFRQDLHFDGETRPFATLHWKHTLTSIRLLDLIPGVGTSVLIANKL